ncbi:hypothetical protein [Dyadobacter sp. 676]|uniref:Uncharacterized protein n=1 Tax=Dyadobacter sp. 676 TaxID=3088362 RepID=A0AAU8FEY9_9BACT
MDLVAKGIGVYRKELDAEIRSNMVGAKECINQPFSPYLDKINLLINGLEEALDSATYLGFTISNASQTTRFRIPLF